MIWGYFTSFFCFPIVFTTQMMWLHTLLNRILCPYFEMSNVQYMFWLTVYSLSAVSITSMAHRGIESWKSLKRFVMCLLNFQRVYISMTHYTGISDDIDSIRLWRSINLSLTSIMTCKWVYNWDPELILGIQSISNLNNCFLKNPKVLKSLPFRFATTKTLRGSHWRGRDWWGLNFANIGFLFVMYWSHQAIINFNHISSADVQKDVYPGRKSSDEVDVYDINCNGIYGINKKTGLWGSGGTYYSIGCHYSYITCSQYNCSRHMHVFLKIM